MTRKPLCLKLGGRNAHAAGWLARARARRGLLFGRCEHARNVKANQRKKKKDVAALEAYYGKMHSSLAERLTTGSDTYGTACAEQEKKAC